MDKPKITNRPKITVSVVDNYGLNCVVTSVNALEVVTSLLHSIGRCYTLIDMTHSATLKYERENGEDYIVYID